jgi:hypothetical protein
MLAVLVTCFCHLMLTCVDVIWNIAHCKLQKLCETVLYKEKIQVTNEQRWETLSKLVPKRWESMVVTENGPKLAKPNTTTVVTLRRKNMKKCRFDWGVFKKWRCGMRKHPLPSKHSVWRRLIFREQVFMPKMRPKDYDMPETMGRRRCNVPARFVIGRW